MDSFYPVFFELLKASGVKKPTQDLLLPFVLTLMIGFILGSITAFIIKKIASLEKKNKKIIQKLESEIHMKDNQQHKTVESERQVELNEKLTHQTEQQSSAPNQEKEPETIKTVSKKEEKKQKKEKKASEFIVKPDPDFKRPEITERQEEEAEWNIVTKNKSKKPK